MESTPMSDPCLLAIGLLTKKQMLDCAPPAPPRTQLASPLKLSDTLEGAKATKTVPTVEISPLEFSKPALSLPALGLPPLPPATAFLPEDSAFEKPPTVLSETAIPLSQFASVTPEAPELMAFSSSRTQRPVSGSQLYRQRLAALNYGQTYTRLPSDSFRSSWANASEQPTYQDWIRLLEQEANALAKGQGANSLAVLVGDSLSMWFPPEGLPGGRLWLNQGISGDTAGGILNRLDTLSQTRAGSIYIMAGINDLRRGESDEDLLWNSRQIVRRLRQEHPQAQVILQSLLPTRLAAIPNSRIRQLNEQLAEIAQQEGARYLDIYTYFTDEGGNLRRELTTDGLHLNPRGYGVWRWALQKAESWIALNQLP